MTILAGDPHKVLVGKRTGWGAASGDGRTGEWFRGEMTDAAVYTRHFFAILDVVPGLCLISNHQAAPWASAVRPYEPETGEAREGGCPWLGILGNGRHLRKSHPGDACWFPSRSSPEPATHRRQPHWHPVIRLLPRAATGRCRRRRDSTRYELQEAADDGRTVMACFENEVQVGALAS